MKKQIIFVDCDDVLYECNNYALDLLNAKYPNKEPLCFSKITSWGLTGTRYDERLAYFSDPEFVSTQPLIEGAQKFIKELSEIAEVYFLTSVPSEVLSARAIRLKQDFPWISESHIILSAAKHLMKSDILLDDSPYNIENSPATYPVLFRKPWNRNITGIMSVNNYEDFLAFVRLVNNAPSPSSIENGGILCLIGPSGSGKQKLADSICKRNNYERIKMFTTKPNAAPEYYTTISEEKFLELDCNGMFAEKSAYGGYYYGIPKDTLSSIIRQGKIAVFPIDICGAITLRNLYPKTIFVYVERDLSSIISSILNKDMSDEEKVKRICSVDREKRNSVLCDFSVSYGETSVTEIIEKI